MRRLVAALAILAACGAEGRESTVNTLALSWQPAVCETLTRAPECRELNAGGLKRAARRLSLHGLWPGPRGREYCGVRPELESADRARRWRRLPEPKLSRATRAALDAAMPGRRSGLDRHEWVKHGSCYGAAGGAEEYFADTLLVAEAVDRAVGPLFRGSLGGRLSATRLRARLDAVFGRGAGQRVRVICRRDGGRLLIVELRIRLSGRIEPGADIGALIRAAPPAAPGCRGGVVDPPGLQ